MLSWSNGHPARKHFLPPHRDGSPADRRLVGLVKAPVLFGAIIAIPACYQGIAGQGNAEDVGKRTTQRGPGDFLVIVLDAFFAVFLPDRMIDAETQAIAYESRL